ncbi:hypothetical protein H5410_018003 [Solanum commersonii]|uniref:Uncharacterized protein n=1 Tax=Solanum commersonii TaxID=4109 RepID=A0A9J6A1M3_SOLCO|nr:hypothetical protein H5410_018003 [Solanum commersonii]
MDGLSISEMLFIFTRIIKQLFAFSVSNPLSNSNEYKHLAILGLSVWSQSSISDLIVIGN